ncbi:MAG: 23S rRNA pseudouridine1911/1915/1917 synthase [Kiritimatiellia bacterium]
MSATNVQVDQQLRLDKVVAALSSVGSRSRAKRAITTGKVDIDGQVCHNPGIMVEAGSTVSVHMNRPGTSAERHAGNQGLVDAGLEILFADDHVVAVNKPPGLLTDTASLEQHRHRDSVRKRLRAWLRARGQLARVVHRIDRDTSGVVLFARTEQAEARLRRQFRERRPERVYHALVNGVVEWEQDRWVDQTRWHKGRRILECVYQKTPGAVETISHVTVLRRFHGASEIEVRLTTGRRNQIRLQAQLRGHPLVGERLYIEPGYRGLRVAERQCLHAARLVVLHPHTNEPLTVTAPKPADWLDVVRTLQRT